MVFKFANFLILCNLFCYSKRLINKQLKLINIAYSLDNKYINLFYTSLYTLLENANKNTIYHIYVQVGDSFDNGYKETIKKFEKIYFNCFIHFLDMKNDFSYAIKGILSSSAYYRLKLPILCPNITRIIYLDSDTLILKDLTELYTLNFEKNYILGRLDKMSGELDSLGLVINNYINSGVLLMDLYNLRKYNYTNNFTEYLQRHNNYQFLNHHDQTLINYVCHDKIGILKPRYHMWPFENETELNETNNKFRIKYNIEEFINDYYNPYIMHFPGEFKRRNFKNRTEYMKMAKNLVIYNN